MNPAVIGCALSDSWKGSETLEDHLRLQHLDQLEDIKRKEDADDCVWALVLAQAVIQGNKCKMNWRRTAPNATTVQPVQIKNGQDAWE